MTVHFAKWLLSADFVLPGSVGGMQGTNEDQGRRRSLFCEVRVQFQALVQGAVHFAQWGSRDNGAYVAYLPH